MPGMEDAGQEHAKPSRALFCRTDRDNRCDQEQSLLCVAWNESKEQLGEAGKALWRSELWLSEKARVDDA